MKRWIWRTLGGLTASAVLLTGLLVSSRPPDRAWAQGVGLWQRATCSSITSPVAASTFCLEASAPGTLKVYTGATYRQVNMLDVIDIRDYGAKVDGVTNDQAAWDAAIAAITNNGTIFVPEGTSLITALTMTKIVNLVGTGMNRGGAQPNRGSILKGVGAGAHVLRYNGASLLRLSNLTIDGGEVKAATVILDGPSSTGLVLDRVELIGATDVTLDIAPTAATQVDTVLCLACQLQSTGVRTQLRVTSTNALNLAFVNPAIANGTESGIEMSGGSVDLFSASFGGSYGIAAINFLNDAPQIRVYSGHAEGLKVLNAPVGSTATATDINGSMFFWFNHGNAASTEAVTWARNGPLYLYNSHFDGDVRATGGGRIVSQGVTFSEGKGFIGTGSVIGGRIKDAMAFTSGVSLGAELPGYVNDATANTTNTLVLPFWLLDMGEFSGAGQIVRYGGLLVRSTAIAETANGQIGSTSLLAKRAGLYPSLNEILRANGDGSVDIDEGGLTLGLPTGGYRGIGTLNVASATLLNGVVALKSTGTPTCLSGCGDTPSVAGTDSAMRVTVSTNVTTTFLVNFATAWAGAPACIAMLDGARPQVATVTHVNTTATGATINTIEAPTNGTVYTLLCQGVTAG